MFIRVNIETKGDAISPYLCAHFGYVSLFVTLITEYLCILEELRPPESEAEETL